MRQGHLTSDLFDSKFVLVSRNGVLVQHVRRKCRELGTIDATSVPPIVHRRQLATIAWLRTGLSSQGKEIPKRHLLAACERVLRLRKGLIEKVRSFTDTLSEETRPQIEALLTQDRSTQVLMDLTHNLPNVITNDNFDLLVDAMKASLIEDEKNKHEIQRSNERREARRKLRAEREKKSQAEELASRARLEAASYKSEDRNIIEKLIFDCNRLSRKSARTKNLVYLCIAVIISFLLIFTEL